MVRTVTHHQFKLTRFHYIFQVSIIKAQFFFMKLKNNFLFLTRFQCHLLKTSQFLYGASHRRYQITNIQLHSFLACTFTSILYLSLYTLPSLLFYILFWKESDLIFQTVYNSIHNRKDMPDENPDQDIRKYTS